MGRKKIIISVTNNLVTDQRVHRVSSALSEMGFDVRLVGRNYPAEKLSQRPYETRRLTLLINKGPLFYAFFNIRLFFYLLFHNADLFLANDADTFPANYLASKLKGKPLIIDCHEYFTEVPEVKNRRFVKSVWKAIERNVLPAARAWYTVSGSVAEQYRKHYGITMEVVRNVPYKNPSYGDKDGGNVRKGKGNKIILYQGAVNEGRGVELAVKAMKNVDCADLVIAGDGDVMRKVKKLVKEEGLEEKVTFLGKVPFEQLPAITAQADLGLSIEDLSVPSYRWALPNKFFDYMVAGVPVVVTPHKETAMIVEKYKTGVILNERTTVRLGAVLNEVLSDDASLDVMRRNSMRAAEKYCWEKESEKLMEIFRPFLNDAPPGNRNF